MKGLLMNATIRQLRASTRTLLEEVKRGRSVILTHRGKPCARLVPYADAPRETDAAFGMWKDHPRVESVNDFINGLRKGRFE